tara:strand:- start:14 stop:676 length:663 start_codon:yes stop_codon:yes gene_type:complete
MSKIHTDCININQIANNNMKNRWILSFDDGFSSDFEIVLPLMKKYKIKGVFFITTNYVGEKNYLNWEQIKLMSDEGMEIGSHSVNHYDMLSLSNDERIYELEISKKLIEKNISKKIKSFSFPFGRFNKEIISEVYRSGYEYCFTSKPGRFNSNVNAIPRISINGSMSEDEIIKILNKNKLIYFKTMYMYNIRRFAKFVLGINYYWKIRRFLNNYFFKYDK